MLTPVYGVGFLYSIVKALHRLRRTIKKPAPFFFVIII